MFLTVLGIEKKYNVKFLQAINKWKFLNIDNFNFAVNKREQFEKISKIFNNFKNENFTLQDMIKFVKLSKLNFTNS